MAAGAPSSSSHGTGWSILKTSVVFNHLWIQTAALSELCLVARRRGLEVFHVIYRSIKVQLRSMPLLCFCRNFGVFAMQVHKRGLTIDHVSC